MFLLVAVALISLVAITMTIRDVARDGYRCLPTRRTGEETLARYR